MFDLFGAEMPLAVRFFLAFLIVLGLIGVTAWAVRRLGTGRLGPNGVRGRQPRIAVIDHASVDGRRRLILVRRDNVEHLLMVGGPSDVVVEANIVRATSAAAGARGPAVAETAPRAMPLPELASNGGSWPLQPESSTPATGAALPRRVSRIESGADEAAGLPPPIDTPSRTRESLTSLADDLAANPLAPAAPNLSIAPAPSRSRSTPPGRPLPAEGRAEHRPDPRNGGQPTSPEAIAAADKTLAEMAQRLEAALRKPKATEAPAHSGPARGTPAEQTPAMDTAAPQPTPMRPLRPVDTKPARADGRANEGKAIYETLEQEMANLLGRQPNKN